MQINTTNIKLLLGESSNTFDTRINMSIPSLLDQIIEYCKNEFLKYNNYTNLYLYDTCAMTITSNTITLTTSLPLAEGDFFRLYGTSYNDGMYQVKSYASGVINIEVVKTLRTETVTSGYIALVEFPSEFMGIIAEYIKDSVINDSDIQREKIDDVEYTYFQSNAGNDITSNNASILNKYRKVFKEKIFGGDCCGC
jgi:hypothetical protein